MTTWYDVLEINDIDAVLEYIASGADVNEKDDDGKTPLMHAALSGYSKL